MKKNLIIEMIIVFIKDLTEIPRDMRECKQYKGNSGHARHN